MQRLTKKIRLAANKIVDDLKWRWFCRLAFAAIILFVIVSSSLKIIKDGGDIDVYFHAARQIVDGSDIYATAISEYQLHYIYLPLFAVLFIPLAVIPRELAIFLWTTFSIFLTGWTIYSFYKLIAGVSPSELNLKKRWTIIFFSLALVFDSLLPHLKYGQTNILVMAAAVLAIKLIEARKEVGGGFVFGITAVIKVIIFPSIAWYFFQRRLRVVAGAITGGLVGLVLPGFVVGFEKNFEYIKYWTEKIALHSDLRNHFVPFTNNLSLQAVMYRLFSNTTAFEYRGENYSLTIFALPDSMLLYAARLIVLSIIAALLIYYIKCRKSPRPISHWGGVALSFALAPLFTGVAEKYHFVLLLPAYVYVVYLRHDLKLKDKLFRALIVASFVSTTLTTKFFVGEFLNKFLFALGCISWGAIFLAAAIFRAARCLKNSEFEQSNIEVIN